MKYYFFIFALFLVACKTEQSTRYTASKQTAVTGIDLPAIHLDPANEKAVVHSVVHLSQMGYSVSLDNKVYHGKEAKQVFDTLTYSLYNQSFTIDSLTQNKVIVLERKKK